MRETVYEVRDVVKRYSPKAPPSNDRITLDIFAGEVFGLLGPNGAGKSTLVRQLAGLSVPTSGSIRLLGKDLETERQLASSLVAVQPQGSSLPVQSRPREVIEITGQLRGMSRQEARESTAKLLDRFGLTAHAEKKIVQLSGGLKRLVNISATLIGDRPILIFDEPTNDLDPEVRRVVWQTIREAAQSGTTVILVTHNVVEAEQALDRVAIMKNGSIIALGTPSELKGRIESEVRLEVTLKEGVEIASIIDNADEALPLGKRRYAFVVKRDNADSMIASLLSKLGGIDDFRIVTPTLEDVYIKLGGERLAGSES